MALPRYQGGQVSLGRSGVAMAHQAQANTIESFVQGIQGIKAGAIQQVADVSAQQAKMDAEQAFAQRGLQADINNDLTVYGKQYTQTLQGLHKKQLSIATGEQFKSFYEDNKDNPAKFEAESEAHYKATMKMLPPHLQADYAIDYEANKAMYSGKVKANRIALDKDRDVTTTYNIFDMSYDAGTQAAREGNQDVAVYNMVKGINALEESYENKNITLEERDKGIAKMQQGISYANFKGVNDGYIKSGDLEGSQKYIDDFRGKTIDGFDDFQREKLADDMESDLIREVNARNAAAKVTSKYDNEEAKKLIKLANSGEDIEDVTYDTALTSNASPEVKEELAFARLDAGRMKKFNKLGIVAQEKEIKDARAQTGKSADDLRLIRRKEKAHEEALKLRKDDPLLYSQGKVFEEKLEFLNVRDPNILSKAEDRVEQVKKSIAFTGRKNIGLFQKSEISAAKSEFKSMNVDEKMTFIDAVNGLEPMIAENTFYQVGGEFMFAGVMAKQGSKEVAELSLLGKGADVKLEEAFVSNLKTKMAGVYGELGADFINANIDGITNYAKGSLANGDDLSYTEAIKNSVGEIVTYSDKKTLLPIDIDQSKFESWLDNITIPNRPALTKGLNNLTDFWSPDSEFQLHYAGQGKYYVKAPNGGNPAFVLGDDGEKFVLDYYGEY